MKKETKAVVLTATLKNFTDNLNDTQFGLLVLSNDSKTILRGYVISFGTMFKDMPAVRIQNSRGNKDFNLAEAYTIEELSPENAELIDEEIPRWNFNEETNSYEKECQLKKRKITKKNFTQKKNKTNEKPKTRAATLIENKIPCWNFNKKTKRKITKKYLKELLEKDLADDIVYENLKEYNIILNLRNAHSDNQYSGYTKTDARSEAVNDVYDDIEYNQLDNLITEEMKLNFKKTGYV